MDADTSGDFFISSSPGTVRLPPESAAKYIRTRFRGTPAFWGTRGGPP